MLPVTSSAKGEAGHADPSLSCRSAFEPETIRVMSIAFEEVCQDLDLRLRDDPATRLVAEKIVQFAQWGIRDVETLRALTLKEFRQSSSN
jgi:hypothetical protein